MNQDSRAQILIIEDDLELQQVLKLLLAPHYTVQCASDGVEGLKMALRFPPDLILLDIKMPHMDGFQTCQMIRTDKEFDDVPILVVSGFGGDDERTRALDFGADDFISKPFSHQELIARIKRRLEVSKKERSPKAASSLTFGDLRLDLASGKVFLNSTEIHFSQKEFRLLQVLVENGGRLVTREDILEKVWDKQAGSNRVIDPHIVSIREKLMNSQVSISSIYGKGYIIKQMETL